jgi:sn1-specific diacylglycerol lipase
MPPLVACGRTWEFGSDDLVFPSAVSVFVRSLWLVGVIVGVVLFRDALTCQHTHLLGAFSFAVIGLLIITIVFEIAITYFSARGTIVRARPRKPVVHLLHLRVLLFLLEILLLLAGTVFAFLPTNERDYDACPDLDNAVLTTQVIVGVSWAVIFLIVMFLLVYLDPCHCYSAKVNYSTVEKHVREGLVDSTVVQDHWQVTHSVWEKRFRVACCMAGSDDSHQHAYGEVAEIFSHLFCDVNVVLSDIAAGLVLLQKEHLVQEEESRTLCVSLRRGHRCVDFNNPQESELFRRMLHYITFAMAPYSWPLYAYMNPLTGCCRLLCTMQCCPCYQRQRPNIVSDNSCFCYLAGARQLTGLNEMDIMYASFENDLYRSPFLVCLDHKMQSVVISIRGTLSMQDIITDLIATTEPIEFPGHPTFLVHKGMFKSALWVKDKLDELELLDTCFEKVSRYGLVVTGHSLGSGVACILSMLLRDRYPDLHCFCFSPTSSLVNHAAAEYTKAFVTSVTLGEDMVARLSVSTCHLLKEDIIRVLETCRKPKCQILVEGMFETLCKCFGRPMVIQPSQSDGEERNGHPPHNPEEDSFEFSPLLRESLSTLRFPQRKTGVAAVMSDSQIEEEEEEDETDHRLIPLFAPGRVIHIVDASKRLVSLCGTRTLQAVWAPNDSFAKIRVSPDMLRDHMVDVLQGAMKSVWKEKVAEIEDRALSSSEEGPPCGLEDT